MKLVKGKNSATLNFYMISNQILKHKSQSVDRCDEVFKKNLKRFTKKLNEPVELFKTMHLPCNMH